MTIDNKEKLQLLIMEAADEFTNSEMLPTLSNLCKLFSEYLTNHGVTVQTETPPKEPTKETEGTQNELKTTLSTCPKCHYMQQSSQPSYNNRTKESGWWFVCEKCHHEWNVTDTSPTLKDSGSRREFDTGAVRDIAEGKGRCDLMPLGVISSILPQCDGDSDSVLFHLSEFQEGCDAEEHLVEALWEFSKMRWENRETMLLELAKHFEEGAKKYGEYNWQKGIPVHCYLDSAVRHYLKWKRGDKDEPHDRAFVWNLVCCIWTIKHKPELCDIPHKEEK